MSYNDVRGIAKQTYVDTSQWYSRPLAGLGAFGIDTTGPQEMGPPPEFYMPDGFQFIGFDEKMQPRPELTAAMQLSAGQFNPSAVAAGHACSPDDVVAAGVSGQDAMTRWAAMGLFVVFVTTGSATPPKMCLLGLNPVDFFARRGDKSMFLVMAPGQTEPTTPTKAYWASYKSFLDATASKATGTATQQAGMSGGAKTALVVVGAAVVVGGIAYAMRKK